MRTAALLKPPAFVFRRTMRRVEVERLIEQMIDYLDALDGDTDMEDDDPLEEDDSPGHDPAH